VPSRRERSGRTRQFACACHSGMVAGAGFGRDAGPAGRAELAGCEECSSERTLTRHFRTMGNMRCSLARTIALGSRRLRDAAASK
jgi:arginyl-tRNA--protein-N-Asp/Glu arginylyltransferase